MGLRRLIGIYAIAWLSGKNPEVAIEVQISGNITEAKDRLAQARKFNYRKVVIVLREADLKRLNSLMKSEVGWKHGQSGLFTRCTPRERDFLNTTAN